MGPGQVAATTSVSGVLGKCYGGGGSGSYTYGNITTSTGGNGAAGVII